MRVLCSPFEMISDDAKDVLKYELKAQMMMAIRDLIEANSWTQTEAATKLKVTQPRVSNLLNGKIDKFSLDMLIGMLSRLNVKLELHYKID